MWVGWRLYLKSLMLSGFYVFTSLFMPLLVSTIAFYMFRAGERSNSLLYAALGAGVYGIWSSTLYGSAGALQWQRWQGTLEVLVAAPAPLPLVLLPLTVATASIGVYSLAATLLWGRLLFGVPLHFAHPLLFVASVPAAILGLGLLGFLLASSFILYRYAGALANMVEWPVLFVTGLLVPISLLPAWSRPISWLLVPTWGMRSIRDSALGGSPLPALGMTLLLGAIYFVLGVIFLARFERLARKKATLSLT